MLRRDGLASTKLCRGLDA